MVKLIQGDCMDYMAGLKDNAFELAIVDPPYGIGLDFTNKNGLGGAKIHQDKEWNNKIPTKEYFNELFRVSKNRIIWGCQYYSRLNTVINNDLGRIVWIKSDYSNSKIMFSEADIASYSKHLRVAVFNYLWRGNFTQTGVNYSNSGIDARIHPTQKPIALYEWLLKNYAKEGDRILDTHLGSGSSAIAAYNYGFDFVGIELDKDYYKAAVKRFDQHKQQLTIF